MLADGMPAIPNEVRRDKIITKTCMPIRHLDPIDLRQKTNRHTNKEGRSGHIERRAERQGQMADPAGIAPLLSPCTRSRGASAAAEELVEKAVNRAGMIIFRWETGLTPPITRSITGNTTKA